MSEWISVEGELPPEWTAVLIYKHGQVPMVAVYDGLTNWTNFTHWKKLPEPPVPDYE